MNYKKKYLKYKLKYLNLKRLIKGGDRLTTAILAAEAGVVLPEYRPINTQDEYIKKYFINIFDFEINEINNENIIDKVNKNFEQSKKDFIKNLNIKKTKSLQNINLKDFIKTFETEINAVLINRKKALKIFNFVKKHFQESNVSQTYEVLSSPFIGAMNLGKSVVSYFY